MKQGIASGVGKNEGAAPDPAMTASSTHGGFRAEKGKPIQGLPKRLGAKMRHRDRKGKGKSGKQDTKSKTMDKKTTPFQKATPAPGGEKRNRMKKFKKGRKGDDKEERTFQNLVSKYKGGNKQTEKKSGKKWDA